MNKTTKIIKVLEILKEDASNTMLGSMAKKYDPFKILISTILSARSKDEQTHPICEKLFKKYPNPKSLAKAKKSDVIKIIRKIGFFNQKTDYIINTSKILLKEYKGKPPKSMEELTKLPGVGNKVAACVMVYAYGKDEIPVDIHVAVVSQRLGLTKNKNPDKIMEDLKKITPKPKWQLVNDLMVSFGKRICDTRLPKCKICKIEKYCIYENKRL